MVKSKMKKLPLMENDADLLDEEDISSDEEDMDDPVMVDTASVRDGINKYAMQWRM